MTVPALRRITRRRRLSMTALIDVIFLLLLFFMLSSTFSRFSEIDLTTSGAGAGGVPPEGLGFLRLGETDLSLNGAATTLEGLLVRLERLEVETLAVSVTDAVDAQRLTDVLVLLRNAPDVSVVLLGST